MRRRLAACASSLALVALAFPGAAGAQDSQTPALAPAAPPPAGGEVLPYQANDPGGFRNILPPGSNGLANGADILEFMTTGGRPPHNEDQRDPYADLVFSSPSIDAGEIDDFFKDASFGVREGDVESSTSPPVCTPKGGVTIVRDRGFGVPHIYGNTRSAAMCGIGYSSARDRLFLMDVLRNSGRAKLTAFVGGAEGNREMDEAQWRIAPYREADLQTQFDQLDNLYGADGAQVQQDARDYVDGINAYITEAKADPTKMPGTYDAINMPEGPQPWNVRDIIATASLVGGIFGKGGGRELDNALLLEELEDRFGGASTTDVGGRSEDDPGLGELLPGLPGDDGEQPGDEEAGEEQDGSPGGGDGGGSETDEPPAGLQGPEPVTGAQSDTSPDSDDGGEPEESESGDDDSSGGDGSSDEDGASGDEESSGDDESTGDDSSGDDDSSGERQLSEQNADDETSEGRTVFDDFRRAEDPEAPTTVEKKFPYQVPSDDVDPDSSGLPDPGTAEKSEVVAAEASSDEGVGLGGPGGLLDFPQSASNALLVSREQSGSDHPRAVFGPQVSYFAPQILMEQDVHAPTLDARGSAFPGTNLYVQLGRGRDYSWSATSAGQDIVDTYAVDLCEPGGGDPDEGSGFYVFRGDCEAMEELTRTNLYNTNAADSTVGSQTLRTQRTKLGLVVGRGEIDGQPVAYTQLRTTYFHEVDSAIGFADYNNPRRIKSAKDFQKASFRIGFTFNWFYLDEKDTAYFNAGNNPVRPKDIDHNFPVRGLERFEWRDYDPDDLTADYTDFDEHPQSRNKKFFTSWNNKQAPEYRAADDNFGYGPIHRSQPLDDRIGDAETLPELIDAMEDAATVDLRGDKVLPLLLEVIGDSGGDGVPEAIEKLEEWQEDGAHRRDKDDDGEYEHSDAVAIMDAWWPLLIEAEFQPTLGDDLYELLQQTISIDDPPNGHQGSSYISGWWGYVSKDLRSLLDGAGASSQSEDDSDEEGGPGEDDGDGEGESDGEDAGGDDGGAEDGAQGDVKGSQAGGGGDEGGEDGEPADGDGDGDGSEGPPGEGEGGEPEKGTEKRDADDEDGVEAKDVDGELSRIYCGGDKDSDGDLDSCRDVLTDSLEQAIDDAENRDELYEDELCDDTSDDRRPDDDQVCFDAILFTAVGAITQPLINWQNRPTFQQVVEVQGERPDEEGGGNGGGGGDGSDGDNDDDDSDDSDDDDDDGGPDGGDGQGSPGGGVLGITGPGFEARAINDCRLFRQNFPRGRAADDDGAAYRKCVRAVVAALSAVGSTPGLGGLVAPLLAESSCSEQRLSRRRVRGDRRSDHDACVLAVSRALVNRAAF